MEKIAFSEDLFPVQAFFNALDDERLCDALESFASGHGYNPEDINCFFPEDLAEAEGQPASNFDYIEFWTYAGDETVHVPFQEFLHLLQQVIELRSRPDFQCDLNKLYSSIERRLQKIEAQQSGEDPD
jgi:hypothetical protein